MSIFLTYLVCNRVIKKNQTMKSHLKWNIKKFTFQNKTSLQKEIYGIEKVSRVVLLTVLLCWASLILNETIKMISLSTRWLFVLNFDKIKLQILNERLRFWDMKFIFFWTLKHTSTKDHLIFTLLSLGVAVNVHN